jgi:hypothetical protein
MGGHYSGVRERAAATVGPVPAFATVGHYRRRVSDVSPVMAARKLCSRRWAL